jgi:filamentous hemagglutinin family protein
MARVTRKAKRLSHRTLAVAVASCFSAAAQANPTGPTVTAGNATFQTLGNTLTISNVPGTIIQWQGFSIQANEITRFLQQNSNSAVLNRVTGGQMSQLMGQLLSNGRVFLINPSGIVVGQNAVIDVAALVASSLNLSDKDFLAGRYRFTGQEGTSRIVNQGTITTPAGGFVYLVAPNVENHGIVRSPNGEVILAAGNTVELVSAQSPQLRVEISAPEGEAVNLGSIISQAGRVGIYGASIRNSGRVSADSAVVGENGKIVFKATKDVTLADGSRVEATSAAGKGGSVEVQGDTVALTGDASIDVSGRTGGGSVLVGGDYRGANPDVQNASGAFIGSGASIRADALESGDGGRVVVWSNEATRVHGSISARGAGGGSGGFVETSSKGYLEVTTTPNLGAGGTWLLDPYNIEVVADGTGNSNNDGAPTFTPNGDESKIEAGQISGQLSSNVNVILDTGGAGSPGTQAGNITVNAPIAEATGSTGSLTLNAANNVVLNQSVIVGFNGGGSLTVHAGGDMTVASLVNAASLDLTIGGSLNLANAQLGSGAGQTIAVGGQVSVVSTSGIGAALFNNSGSQNISAGSILVSAEGQSASITSGTSGPGGTLGTQTITVTGAGTSRGIDVQNVGVPGTVASIASSGAQTITVTNADHIAVNAAAGDAQISSGGVQNITIQGAGSNRIDIGSASANAVSQIIGRTQNITAGFPAQMGNPAQQGSINIFGANRANLAGAGSVGIINTAGTSQSVSTSGALSVTGGNAINTGTAVSNAGVLNLSTTGDQTVTASSIELLGGSSGSGNVAIISSSSNQTVSLDGDLGLTSRAGGNATINTPSTRPGNPAITNTQQISAHDISLANGTGGINAASTILSGKQTIHATGNVTLTAQAGVVTPGSLAGVRIGSNGGPTDLTLTVDGDLTLNGGTAQDNAASIGSSGAGTPTNNNITITVGTDTHAGNVLLNGGTAAGAVARIGTGTLQAPAGGDISITAKGGSIVLNDALQPPTAQAAAIRTAGKVTLDAGTTISEGAQGFIEAGKLTLKSGGDATLGGNNKVTSLSAPGTTTSNPPPIPPTFAPGVGGSLTFNNNGALSVTDSVTSGGAMTLTVAGALKVEASGAQDASISSSGGQTIVAQSLRVHAEDGRIASIVNAVGDQSITVNSTGGVGVEVSTASSSGGTAFVANRSTGTQAIQVTNADSFIVNGVGPSSVPVPPPPTEFLPGANIYNLSGAQTISMTGTGANQMLLGSLGAASSSRLSGGIQTIIAGAAGEAGSISITGPTVAVGGAGALAGIVSQPGFSGEQNVSTSGTLSVTGGSSPNQLSNFQTGIFYNGSGLQRITARDLVLQGGAAGANNGAIIAGAGNPALPSGDQIINVSRDISVSGDAGGNASITGAINRLQTVNARNISLTNALTGGNNSAGTIVGTTQVINATGDVTLSANAAAGSNTGARIGGATYNIAGVSTNVPTNLTMTVGGNLTLSGGTAANNGAGIGSASSGTSEADNISIVAGGSVLLKSGTAASTGARIGSSLFLSSVAGGDISVWAQTGDITLKGGAAAAAIRTTDNVTLRAGTTITESGNGFIAANLLKTTSSGDTTLTGPNTVKQFDGTTTTGGNITLNNSGPLVIQAINTANAAVTNAGSVAIRGGVATSGSLTMNVAGALSIEATGAQDVNVNSGGGQELHAQSLTVTASGLGRAANLLNTGGAQTIDLVGGNLELLATGETSSAVIGQSGSGPQRITVLDGDHISLSAPGLFGFASINASSSLPDVSQEISITGSGANALSLGAGTNIGGPNQTITAGATGQSGSISTSGAGSFIQSVGGFAPGQTISTSGAFTIAGSAQVLNDSFGLQLVRAGSLSIADGGALRSNGGQDIAAGSISLSGNVGQASITNTNNAQTIAVTGGNLDLVALGAGGSAVISNGSFSGGQTITVTNGDHIDVSGTGFQSSASIQSSSAQTISITGTGANAITVGTAGGLGSSNVSSGGAQSLVAGTAGSAELGSVGVHGGNTNGFSSSVFTIAGTSGDQFISTAGALSVTGGEASAQAQNRQSGIFQQGSGSQTVSADSISLQGGASGATNGALISSGNGAGSQFITTSSGDLALEGRAGGNATLIGSPVGFQFISAGRDITLTNDNVGGASSAAIVGGAFQSIGAGRDIKLTARASGGALPGVRIGGGTQATNLTLSAGRDLLVNGGTADSNGAGIGSSITGTALDNNISISAGGNVVLTGGTASLAGARIGYSTINGPAGGDISINATGDIVLNGDTAQAAIRSLGNVTLNARSITENTNGLVVANNLSLLTTTGDAQMAGPNQVANLSTVEHISIPPAPPVVFPGVAGVLNFKNTTDLVISGNVSSGGAMTLDVDGALTLAGSVGPVPGIAPTPVSVRSSGGQTIKAHSLRVTSQSNTVSLENNGTGAQTITIEGGTPGAGIDVEVLPFSGIPLGPGSARIANNAVGGSQSITVNGGGAVDVNANVAGSSAVLMSNGSQTIHAGSLSVRAQNGGVATVRNSGVAGQTIAISGDAGTGVDVEVQGTGGGSAQISNAAGAQGITVTGGDFINVNAASGSATINSSGFQTISATGGGANAITVGSVGALGASGITGPGQSITAGTGLQKGSIKVTGPDTNTVTAVIAAIGGLGNSQTISTTGLLSVVGGKALNHVTTGTSANTGIFNNTPGLQWITAGSLSLHGGDAGANNTAILASTGTIAGNQLVNVAGALTVAGGAGAGGNTASLTNGPGAIQTVNAGSIEVRGAAGGTNNSAFIQGGLNSGLGEQHIMVTHDISLINGDGGANSVAAILAPHQTISAGGDVTLTSQASVWNGGAPLPGVRIGGGTGFATDLVLLDVGGNLKLNGGTVDNNGAGIGSSASGTAMDANIHVKAGGYVELNGGSGVDSGARIGSSTVNGIAGGSISVIAGGDIRLKGGTSAAGIRTTQGVTLNAGGAITENANGEIFAGALNTTSGGDTNLTGSNNKVASFSGTSTGGSVTLNNAAPLVVQGINAANAALLKAPSVSGPGAITTGSGLTVDVALDSSLDGVISGAGGLTKNGVGFLSLGAVNTYTGDTNVNVGTLALAAPDQTTTGNINIAGGATFRGSPGTYNNAGVIAGNGTLDVTATSFTNSGTLRPGGAGAIGTLTVAGDAVLNGTLDVEAQGAGAGGYDVLAVTGAATLGGGLNVTAINGYVPQFGDTLVPLTFASRSGALNVNPTDWMSTYNPGNLTLNFVPTNRWVAATGNWDVAANWSLGHVPTNFETVLIDVPGSQFVTVSAGAQTARRLTSNENFVISGGSLSLGGPSTFNSSLSLLGGELTGAGNVTVNGAFIWTGGRLTGAGSFLTSAGTVSLLAPFPDDLLLGKAWTNQGTVNWINVLPRSIVGTGSIQNQGTFNVFGQKATIETQFSNSGTLNLFTDLDLRQSSGNAGTVNVSGGTTLQVHGPYTNSGRLAGQGTVVTDGGPLVNQGTVAPGADGGRGIGTFSVQGDFQQGPSGVLEIDLGGTQAGQFDTLDVNGAATLGGTLFLRAAGSYVPRDGDDFKLVTYKSRVGTFQFVLPPAGFTVDSEYAKKFASFELEQ